MICNPALAGCKSDQRRSMIGLHFKFDNPHVMPSIGLTILTRHLAIRIKIPARAVKTIFTKEYDLIVVKRMLLIE